MAHSSNRHERLKKAERLQHPRKSFPEKTHKRPHKPHLKQKGPEAEPVLKGVLSRIGKPEEAPFQPDTFQLEALEAIKRTDCLVTAPTGSGKTWIAEQAIRSVFAAGGRAWYASPLKALTNSKWVEFGLSFNDKNVGILTGDTKENTDAPIIVGTTEILRNQLYDAMYHGEDLNCDLVILDEAHFLGDEDRGVVWEEIMIYLPRRVNLLLLSATIGNSHEIASWLSSIRKKECVVVEETKRPVPLYPLFLHPSGRVMPFLNKKRLYGKVEALLKGEDSRNRRGNRFPAFGEIIETLRHFDLLPAIFFLKSRSDCDSALRMCRRRTEEWETDGFGYYLEELLERFPYLKNHKQLPYLSLSRVASHHGGQLPAWKFLVEAMMKKGYLDAIFATTTVAAGVNFPARTIVLFNSDQFNGHEFLPLTATGFHQMTGRSGRRGQDRIGFMMLVPGRFMDMKHVRELLFSPPDRIESRIRSDFSMALNLLLSHTPEDVKEMFERSLAAHQHSGKKKRDTEDTSLLLWKDFQKHLAFLKQEGFVDDNERLTEDGLWASKLRLDKPLLIAECLRKGVFPEDDSALLAGIIAPFVQDGDSEIRLDRRDVPRKLRFLYKDVMSTIAPLAERMKTAGFPVGRLPLWAAVLMYHWARGMEWERIIRLMGIAEGDLTMLVSRTADNLRQIASLKDTYRQMAALALDARERILREPVVFE
ncbi:MAG: DEAD/DEAH box helicase [Syntrophobacterales bacterium]|nr:DEAD/DEAH box helicase [Syntrophobacterales bacterium]